MCKTKIYWYIVTVVILSTGIVSPISAVAQPVPSFQMKLTNGKSFSSANLSQDKPLIFIYFAPDCEHCQVLMDSLFKRIEVFKKCQMIMVTFKPLEEVVDFEKHYKTHNYQNITVGTEVPIFFFRKYYQLESTPFTALYDKKGNLAISYKKQTPVDDLIKHLQLLK